MFEVQRHIYDHKSYTFIQVERIMAGDKKEEEQQQEHIPTTNESKEEDEGKQGSGGLLSAVGDPAGESILHLTSYILHIYITLFP